MDGRHIAKHLFWLQLSSEMSDFHGILDEDATSKNSDDQIWKFSKFGNKDAAKIRYLRKSPAAAVRVHRINADELSQRLP